MKDRIINRIQDLSNKIEQLHDQRDNILKELRMLEVEITSTSKVIIELTELIREEGEEINEISKSN